MCERASAIHRPEYPLEVPISRIVLNLRSFISKFKNFPVCGEMLKYVFLVGSNFFSRFESFFFIGGSSV